MTPKPPTAAEDQSPAKLLRERLRAPIAVEQFAVESLQEALGRVRQDVLSLAGVPVCELLLNPDTEPAALVTLKNCAKKIAVRLPRPSAEYDAMLAIYYAAIASTLLFHRQNISSHSREKLTQSFLSLKDQPWMAWELAELFAKAATT